MKPNSSDQEQEQHGKKKDTPGFGQVVLSVLAAAVGVQSNKNRQRDFEQKNSIYVYIVAGIVFTALFVAAVAMVVKLVLN